MAQIIYFCKNNNKIRIPMKENVIKLHDKKFKVMIPAAKIEEAVAAVAAKINEDYREKRNPLFLGVLNGSFMFMSDLLKKIDFNCEISFVKLSSYCGTSSSGDVKCLIGLGNNIEGRDVIIVEDIVDTGASIEHMVEELKTKKPASIRVCTLFFKPKAYQRQIPIDYPAMHIGNEFIVGYGLDYDQLGRNYKDVYVVTEYDSRRRIPYGKPAYFIRLGGCDVGCRWCDAKYTWNPKLYPPPDISEVVRRATSCQAQAIVITGGEQ